MYLNFKKILICFITWIVIKVSSRVKVSSFFCEQHVISSTLHVYRMSLLIAHRVHIIGVQLLYPDSGISMDEELVLGDMIWSYNKAEL